MHCNDHDAKVASAHAKFRVPSRGRQKPAAEISEYEPARFVNKLLPRKHDTEVARRWHVEPVELYKRRPCLRERERERARARVRVSQRVREREREIQRENKKRARVLRNREQTRACYKYAAVMIVRVSAQTYDVDI